MGYQEYIENWLNGLEDEIRFWNDYISSEGGNYFYGFYKTISKEKPFELDDDIPSKAYGKKYKFVDVGSGPFSRCGVISNRVILDAVSIDPLAYAYNNIKMRNGINNGIILKNGFVELLDKMFKPNSFDMVHMSNSLDHCFSAIDGIYQLINICKIGGKIILRHHENEAENENYVGLHQWNLSLHNEENSFVIWRNQERYDVCELFKDYVEFELCPDIKEKGGYWIYNKVIMTKKKDVVINSDIYYEKMLDAVYKKMINKLLSNMECDLAHPSNDLHSKRIKKMKAIYHDYLRCGRVLANEKIEKVAIYGMGCLGKNLNYVLEKMNIDVVKKFDKAGSASGTIDAIPVEKCGNISVDAVIVTAGNDDVYMKLQEKGSFIIYSIDEFLALFD